MLGMFVFGICATSFLWVYTYLHYAPFKELRQALIAEYSREAMPRVDGGKEKGRGPRMLRVVLSVDFDPEDKSPEAATKIASIEKRVGELAKQHVDLTGYEEMEVCLVHLIPEAIPKRHETRKPLKEMVP